MSPPHDATSAPACVDRMRPRISNVLPPSSPSPPPPPPPPPLSIPFPSLCFLIRHLPPHARVRRASRQRAPRHGFRRQRDLDVVADAQQARCLARVRLDGDGAARLVHDAHVRAAARTKHRERN